MAGETGVTCDEPTPAAVAPIRTILPAYLLGRNLPAQDVIERIDLEGRMPFAALVEEGVHPGCRIGQDLQLAQMDLLAQADPQIRRAEIEALGGNHQRQRRIELIEVLHDQWFGPHTAVNIQKAVQMAKRDRLATQNLDRDLRLGRRQRETRTVLDLLQPVSGDEFGQRLVGPTARLAKLEQQRQQDVPRLAIALRQFSIGVEGKLGLHQHGNDLFGFRAGRRPVGPALIDDIDQPGDVGVTGVQLRLGEEYRIGDHLRLAQRQLIGEPGMQFARPRPAAQIGNTLVVDGNHRHFVGRCAGRHANADVVGLAFQALEQVAIGQYQYHRAGHQPEEPVAPPELRPFHASVMPFRLICPCRATERTPTAPA